MNNFFHELDVESVLQCPVCYELPPNIIYVCKVGHHMCERCRKRLTTCPTCKSAITGCRSFLGESLVSKFSPLFKAGGDAPNNNTVDDQIVPKRKHISENENQLKPLSLPPGIYKCLLESCRNRKEMAVGHMFAHVESAHAHIYEKFQNGNGTFTHLFENFCFKTGKHKYHRAFHVSNMGLFFLNLEVLEEDYVNCWISTPAPLRRCNLFQYEVEFFKEDENKRLQFISQIASNVQTAEWLGLRGRVFVVSPTDHKLHDNEFFSLDIKIVYKPPPS